jgi:hypothetical protein
MRATATEARPGAATLRRATLATAILLVAQTALGMLVNLYVTVPGDHPGAHPANYFTGSLQSLQWAIGHGAVPLTIHASLGLALALAAIWVAVRAVALQAGAVGLTSVLAALLIIGAGFNGASFLDFDDNLSSLLMALLALGALCSYLVGLYLLADRPQGAGGGGAHTGGQG